MSRYCEICGKEFQLRDKGWSRRYCYDCAPHEDNNISHAQAVAIKRRAIKKVLVDYKGGKCQYCGYDKSLRALQFHHLDPNIKDFGISENFTRGIPKLKEEVDKCILLCSNCHAELHEQLELERYNINTNDKINGSGVS